MSLARAALIALAPALIASQALAHGALVSSTPADKASTAPVSQISLKFNEPISAKLSGATVSSSRMMMNGRMTAMAMKVQATAAPDPKDPAGLILTLKAPLVAGEYKVEWHVVTNDTHRTVGSFGFTVK